MLSNFDEINLILDQMSQENMIEQAAEPIDCAQFEVDFWDWAQVLGIVDEFVPEEYNA